MLTTVYDAGPALKLHWVNVSCLLDIDQENMKRSPKVGSMLGQYRTRPPKVGSTLGHRRRRWSNIDPTLGDRLVFLCSCHIEAILKPKKACVCLDVRDGDVIESRLGLEPGSE